MIDEKKLIAEIERRRDAAKYYDISGGDAPIYDDLLAFIKSNLEEKPSEDLEKQAEETADECPCCDFCHESQIIERVEWLKEQLIRFAEIGAQRQKEQMMKGAVEGVIHPVGFHNAVYIKEPEWTETLDKIKKGATVKIIIIKED